MAEVVEESLGEHVTHLDSHIKDTTDFLNKINDIQQPLEEKTLMFCMDVKGLYPNVPRKEARESVNMEECTNTEESIIMENNNNIEESINMEESTNMEEIAYMEKVKIWRKIIIWR